MDLRWPRVSQHSTAVLSLLIPTRHLIDTPSLSDYGLDKSPSPRDMRLSYMCHLNLIYGMPVTPGVFLAATKQLYKWYFPSVRLSVCPSVRPSVTPFWLYSHHRIIMKFSGVITSDRSDVHAKGQGQSSKVKVTEVTTQFYRFRTVTPVWIHVWCWNDAHSLIMPRRGALLFFKVICQISRSHGSKNRQIWPILAVSGL